jgi:5-methylcytosine-specific restriction endonuclease McrA
MKFVLEKQNRGASDEELLNDLRQCAKTLGKSTITASEYEAKGKVHPSTLTRRFGSWFKILEMAGLEPSRSAIKISDEELLCNIESLWTSLGRQPRYQDVRTPLSKYSAGTYENRFGSWSKSLERFIGWINEDSNATDVVTVEPISLVSPSSQEIKHITKRNISERQRFRILVRDGFRCMTCGATPLTKVGVELHIDHILPWSLGGETVDENLQTKCKQCNLGKGNTFTA